jgi:hypothetical protein
MIHHDPLYTLEKLACAIEHLTLPHRRGPVADLISAMHMCSVGLSTLDDSQLDDEAMGWVDIIRTVLATDGLENMGEGLSTVRAQNMTDDEIETFANAIVNLERWLDCMLRAADR